MNDVRDISSPSSLDFQQWNDTEEFKARMKYEGRAAPIPPVNTHKYKLRTLLPVFAVFAIASVFTLSFL